MRPGDPLPREIAARFRARTRAFAAGVDRHPSARGHILRIDSTGSGFVVFRVAFVCVPPSAPFVVTASFPDAAAGAEAVDAWLVPVDPGTPTTCGALAAPEPVGSFAPRTGTMEARTSGNVVAFASCGSGEVRSGTLVLDGELR